MLPRVAITVFAALVLLGPGTAGAAYPADPAADGNPAFCVPKKPVQDFGLSNLPPVREVPESGEELGRGAVSIYGGWSRILSKPYGFGYGFSEHNYSGKVQLDWTVTAELWAIDGSGIQHRQVDREELFIGRLDAADQPHIEVQPPKGRRGFYRFDMRITNRDGEVLGSYSAYFKVVRPYWQVKLALARDVLRPGQRLFSRLENYGTETVEYGESFGIQRREGGKWLSQPDLLQGAWLLWLGFLGPGQPGLCNSVTLPKDLSAGLYRVVKRVWPGPKKKKGVTLTAPFTVQG